MKTTAFPKCRKRYTRLEGDDITRVRAREAFSSTTKQSLFLSPKTKTKTNTDWLGVHFHFSVKKERKEECKLKEMTTLSSFLPSLSPPLPPNHLSTSQTQQLSHSILWPKLSSTSITLQPRSIRRHRTVALGTNSGDPKGSSRFLDENGAVDDMDGYLNHLSLEYDSVWDTKPSW